MMRSAYGAAANAILRQIGIVARLDDADRQKPILIIEDVRSEDWASLTFVGERHEFDLLLEGDADGVAMAVTQLCTALADHDIPLGGAFVAEIRCVAGDCEALPAPRGVARKLRVEALSIRD